MNNQIRIFKNEMFGEIRTAGSADNPLFCLADLCRVLDLQVTPTKNRLRQSGVSSIKVGVQTGTKKDGSPAMQYVDMIFVNEQNLYKVIMRSDKPQAEPFQDWVCGEVLPTLRKTGTYSIAGKQLLDFSNPAEAARAWADQYELNQKQQKLIEESKPKVEFFDAVASSKDAIEMKAVANTLDFVNVGRNKLFEILRDNDVLTQKNQPEQRFIDNECFRTIEQRYEKPDGEICINIKTLVYQKGIKYIKNLLEGLGYKQRKQKTIV